jgi:hypothetical protein
MEHMRSLPHIVEDVSSATIISMPPLVVDLDGRAMFAAVLIIGLVGWPW